ncbi:NB-ARC domain-containing protein [Amycolatopsis sp. NPDC059027]|uniref:NB-ARC domain-containing protein n=1 Tax=Amycolatopsis sp. NPDC059027 TaxID=3346709 RepID=UPI0036701FDE
MADTRNEVSGVVVGTVVQARTVTFAGQAHPAGPVWMVPEPARELVERAEAAERLTASILAGDATIGVVAGGGFGKTTLVAQVCRRVRDAFPGGVLWVTLGEQVPDPVLADKINDLSELLSGSRPTLVDPAAAAHRLAGLLGDRERTLLVVDDVWTAGGLSPFLLAGVQIVATTRSRGTLPATVRAVTVEPLSPGESRSLLALGLPGLTRTERLLRLTGRWALLLALVNAALRQAVAEGTAPDAAADLVAGQLSLDGPGSLDLDSADRRDHAVRATVEASIRRLDPVGRTRFLELGVFPEDVDVPVAVVHLLWRAAGLAPAACRRLTRQLVDLSLAEVRDETMRLHDVLRTYLRQTLGQDELADVSGRLADALRAEAPADWATARPYTLRHLAGHAADAGRLDPLLTDAGFLLAAEQSGLLPCLSQAKSEQARTAALAYQRAAHHLRDQPPGERPAYLELTARQTGAATLTEAAGRLAVNSPWRCTWTDWHTEPPHHILTRHNAKVIDVAPVPFADGRVLVFSLDVGHHVRIVEAHSNQRADSPWPLPELVEALACVPLTGGGHVFLAGTMTGEIRAWDVDSGEPVSWELPPLPVDPVETVDPWDASAAHERSEDLPAAPEPSEPDDPEPGTEDYVEDLLALEPAGPDIDWYACWNDYREDILPGVHRILWTPAPGGPVVAIVRAHRLVHLVASTVSYQDVSVWAIDTATGRRIRTPWPGTADRFALDLQSTSDRGDHRATVSGAGWTHSWDVISGKVLEDDRGCSARSSVATWLPDGSEVSCYGGGSMWITATPDDRVGTLVHAHSGPIQAVATTTLPDGRVVVVTGGFDDRTVRLWDVRELVGGEPATPTGVGHLAVAGGLLVTGHAGPVLRVWSEGRPVREVVLDARPTALIAAPDDRDGPRVVCDTAQGPPTLVDPATGERTACPAAVTGRALACTSTDGQRVLLTDDEGTVRAWDLADGAQLWQLPSREPTAMSTSDGHFVVNDGATGRLSIHDPRTGQPGPSITFWPGRSIMVGVLPGTDVTGDEPLVVFHDAFLHAWAPGAKKHLAAKSLHDKVYDTTFRRRPNHGGAIIANDTALLRLSGGVAAAALGGRVLRLARLVPTPEPKRSERLAHPCEWEILCDVDLDTEVTALAVDHDGTLVVGTARGIARLRLANVRPESRPAG